jgi:hypothetical protein
MDWFFLCVTARLVMITMHWSLVSITTWLVWCPNAPVPGMYKCLADELYHALITYMHICIPGMVYHSLVTGMYIGMTSVVYHAVVLGMHYCLLWEVYHARLADKLPHALIPIKHNAKLVWYTMHWFVVCKTAWSVWCTMRWFLVCITAWLTVAWVYI